MHRARSFFWSSIGKKVINALTGLGLSVFVVVHLLGNLALFSEDPASFNSYSHFLYGLGWLLVAAEIGLGALFAIHIIWGVTIWFDKRRARPIGYYKTDRAGPPSRQTIFSRTMVLSGLALLIFTIIHLKTFKFGPGMANGYVVTIDGERMRDLHRLVIGYSAAMILLGFHLRHGFWSAFQSLGVDHPRLTPIIYVAGVIFAIAMAAGFIAIPIWIYFTGGRM